MAVSVWESPTDANGFGLLFDAIRSHGQLDVPLPHGPDFFQFSDGPKMRAALAEMDLRDIDTTRSIKHGNSNVQVICLKPSCKARFV